MGQNCWRGKYSWKLCKKPSGSGTLTGKEKQIRIMSVIGTGKVAMLGSTDSQTSYWSKFMLIISPFQLIKKPNARQRTAEMLNKTAHYSSHFKRGEELECIPEE